MPLTLYQGNSGLADEGAEFLNPSDPTGPSASPSSTSSTPDRLVSTTLSLPPLDPSPRDSLASRDSVGPTPPPEALGPSAASSLAAARYQGSGADCWRERTGVDEAAVEEGKDVRGWGAPALGPAPASLSTGFPVTTSHRQVGQVRCI
eukprot:CAMPEP_0184298636 /NCGR_PEP_ID=MMETSP1049-20130417/9406_1 /TAXON_ID=77928 /ORGANISM="Proteomonas sulcata, Strain CCMP704" /LENGTH=147 /DNA_ID=CAMNT_0026608823 /DNA_START=504 /DNA_END=948 /DNA_ORIENTATION=-